LLQLISTKRTPDKFILLNSEIQGYHIDAVLRSWVLLDDPRCASSLLLHIWGSKGKNPWGILLVERRDGRIRMDCHEVESGSTSGANLSAETRILIHTRRPWPSKVGGAWVAPKCGQEHSFMSLIATDQTGNITTSNHLFSMNSPSTLLSKAQYSWSAWIARYQVSRAAKSSQS